MAVLGIRPYTPSGGARSELAVPRRVLAAAAGGGVPPYAGRGLSPVSGEEAPSMPPITASPTGDSDSFMEVFRFEVVEHGR